MPRIFRRSNDEPVADANLLPVMNIMFLLIPALLLSMEVASLAAITVSPPTFTISPNTEKPDPGEKKPTSLRIRIYEDGFGIELKGARDEGDVAKAATTAGPSIPLVKPGASLDDSTRFDYAALATRVDQLRPMLEEGANLEISAEPEISMQVLVSTIDAAQDPKQLLPLIVSEAF
jgi:biopolymer transport protein ExbD